MWYTSKDIIIQEFMLIIKKVLTILNGIAQLRIYNGWAE